MSIYAVTEHHYSEFPSPISFKKGTLLTVGEIYSGPEKWEGWYFCQCDGQVGGWVPEAVFRFVSRTEAIAEEDYTAHELRAKPGDLVAGDRVIGGWRWCTNNRTVEVGWIPLNKLRPLYEN